MGHPARNLPDQTLAQAFERARALLLGSEPIEIEEVLELETRLRPGVAAPDVRAIMIPLLDRAKLFSLAMLWDCEFIDPSPTLLRPRIDRWIALGAPEFAVHPLADMGRYGESIEERWRAVHAAIDAERAVRAPRLKRNLERLAHHAPQTAELIGGWRRTAVALRPIGAGLAESAGQVPLLQIFGTTADAAVAAGHQMLDEVKPQGDVYLAGVGDCTLPYLAIERDLEGDVHLIDADPAHVRALLELEDFSDALSYRRLLVHTGPECVASFEDAIARAGGVRPDAVIIGGDMRSHALIRAAIK